MLPNMQHLKSNTSLLGGKHWIGIVLRIVSFDRMIITALFVLVPLLTMAQASGGQITRKPQVSRQTHSTSTKKSVDNQERKKGLDELERIKTQGEALERNLEDELLRTNDSNKKLDILKNASLTFERNKDFERAISYYNRYLTLLPQQSIDDFENIAKLYCKFADFYSEYRLNEYKKEMLIKADEVYKNIGQKFPIHEVYATYQRASVNNKLDTNMEKGLAKPYYERIAQLLTGRANKTNGEKIMLKYSLHYLMSYAFLYEGNKAAAKRYASEILAIDPDFAPAVQIRDLP